MNPPAGTGGGHVGKSADHQQRNAVGTSQQPYSIDFQNPSATQPLHTLHVAVPLDADFDPATFRLVEIDLPGLTIPVPDGRTHYETRVDARDTWGVFVDVSAGLDPATGTVAWDLAAVDPRTMDVPVDPALGFLPPDPADPTRRDGSVFYEVGVRAGTADGAHLDAAATITFDGGAPVVTATVTSIVDAVPPTATVNPLPAKSPARFTVSWSGGDPTGVAFFDVYVQVDGGSFARWVTGTSATSATFRGKRGHTYGFAVVAYDATGNPSAPPTSPQATTQT